MNIAATNSEMPEGPAGTTRNESRREGFALTDMVVGLTVLGFSLALCLHAAAQALSAAREAASLDATRRALEWRLDSTWGSAREAGGEMSGAGWRVSAGPVGPAQGWAVCRVEAIADAPRGRRKLSTHRFCKPLP